MHPVRGAPPSPPGLAPGCSGTSRWVAGSCGRRVPSPLRLLHREPPALPTVPRFVPRFLHLIVQTADEGDFTCPTLGVGRVRAAGTVSPSCRQARKGPQAGRRGRCVSRFSSQRGRRGSGRRAVQRDTLSVALRFLGVRRRAAVWASSPRRRAALAPGVRGADEHVCLSRRCFLTYQSCQSLIYRRCLLHDSIARHPAPEGERPRLARLSASRTVAGRAARLSVQGCGAVRGSSRGSRC